MFAIGNTDYGYFNNDHLLEQVERTIDILTRKPGIFPL